MPTPVRGQHLGKANPCCCVQTCGCSLSHNSSFCRPSPLQAGQPQFWHVAAKTAPHSLPQRTGAVEPPRNSNATLSDRLQPEHATAATCRAPVRHARESRVLPVACAINFRLQFFSFDLFGDLNGPHCMCKLEQADDLSVALWHGCRRHDAAGGPQGSSRSSRCKWAARCALCSCNTVACSPLCRSPPRRPGFSADRLLLHAHPSCALALHCTGLHHSPATGTAAAHRCSSTCPPNTPPPTRRQSPPATHPPSKLPRPTP